MFPMKGHITAQKLLHASLRDPSLWQSSTVRITAMGQKTKPPGPAQMRSPQPARHTPIWSKAALSFPEKQWRLLRAHSPSSPRTQWAVWHPGPAYKGDLKSSQQGWQDKGLPRVGEGWSLTGHTVDGTEGPQHTHCSDG